MIRPKTIINIWIPLENGLSDPKCFVRVINRKIILITEKIMMTITGPQILGPNNIPNSPSPSFSMSAPYFKQI